MKSTHTETAVMPIISLTFREKEIVSPICNQAKDKALKPNGIAKYPVGNGNGRLSVMIILLKIDTLLDYL